MRKELLRATASLVCLLTALPATLQAQGYPPAPYAAPQPPLSSSPLTPPDSATPPPPDEAMGAPYGQTPYGQYPSDQAMGTPYDQGPAPTAQAAAPLADGQLDQLLAPVALYPDDLLSQVLMASTYPLDIVEASRWIADPRNAALRGDALAAALEQQQWDPSVKSLVPFPQVLQMLNERLDWTQQLGQAFLAQQDAVMGSVQRLRQEASNHGALSNTPQQTIANQDGAIEIMPANPSTIYVPSYDPRVVYGDWPYPDYPPVYFAPRPGYVVTPLYAGIGFGVGIGVVGALWGWHHWDWGHHRIAIDVGRYNRLNFGRPPIRRDVWVHDVAHDRGFAAQHGFAPRPVAHAPFRSAPYRGEPPARWNRNGATANRGVARPDNRAGFAPRSQAAAPQARAEHFAAPQARPEHGARPSQPQPQARNFARPEHAQAARQQSRPQAARAEAPRQQFAQRPSGPAPQANHQAAPQNHAQPQQRDHGGGHDDQHRDDHH